MVLSCSSRYVTLRFNLFLTVNSYVLKSFLCLQFAV